MLTVLSPMNFLKVYLTFFLILIHDHYYDAHSTPPPPYPINIYIKWKRIMFWFYFSLFAKKQQYISPKLTNFKTDKNCSSTVDRLSKPYVGEHSNILFRRHIWNKKPVYIKWISFFPGAQTPKIWELLRTSPMSPLPRYIRVKISY